MSILSRGASALYRANRQYARLTYIIVIGELFRIILTAAAATAGGLLLASALISSIAIVVFQFWFITFDTSRRFFPHKFPFYIPRWAELRGTFGVSFVYFAQNVPYTSVTHIPNLALATLHAAPGTVASFVLLRTLTNMPRAMLQSFGTVAGQECGRRIAIADNVGAFAIFEHGVRAFSAMSGLCAGFLLASGHLIGSVWTGNLEIVRSDILLAGLAPMLLAPAAVLSHNVLASINAPEFAALGRWVQVSVIAVAALAVPVDNPALRMLIALAAGEIIGYAPLAYYGTWKLMPAASIFFHFRAIGLCMVSAAFGYISTLLIMMLSSGASGSAAFGGIVASLAACAAGFALLGLALPLRRALWRQFIAFIRTQPGIGASPKELAN